MVQLGVHEQSSRHAESRRPSELPPFGAAIASRSFAFRFHKLSTGPGTGCSPSPNDKTPTPGPNVRRTHAHARRPSRQHHGTAARASFCCLGASTSTLAVARKLIVWQHSFANDIMYENMFILLRTALK